MGGTSNFPPVTRKSRVVTAPGSYVVIDLGRLKLHAVPRLARHRSFGGSFLGCLYRHWQQAGMGDRVEAQVFERGLRFIAGTDERTQ